MLESFLFRIASLEKVCLVDLVFPVKVSLMEILLNRLETARFVSNLPPLYTSNHDLIDLIYQVARVQHVFFDLAFSRVAVEKIRVVYFVKSVAGSLLQGNIYECSLLPLLNCHCRRPTRNNERNKGL